MSVPLFWHPCRTQLKHTIERIAFGWQTIRTRSDILNTAHHCTDPSLNTHRAWMSEGMERGATSI